MKNQKAKSKCAECANRAANNTKALFIKAFNTQRARNRACVGRVGLNVQMCNFAKNKAQKLNFERRF